MFNNQAFFYIIIGKLCGKILKILDKQIKELYKVLSQVEQFTRYCKMSK